MYADKMTAAIRSTIEITKQRRTIQTEYNEKHGIIPHSVNREISLLVEPEDEVANPTITTEELSSVAEEVHEYLTESEVNAKIKFYEKQMKAAAKELRFEDAVQARNLMRKYQQIELSFG